MLYTPGLMARGKELRPVGGSALPVGSEPTGDTSGQPRDWREVYPELILLVDGTMNINGRTFTRGEMLKLGVGDVEFFGRDLIDITRLRQLVILTLETALEPEQISSKAAGLAAQGNVEEVVKALENLDTTEAAKKALEGTAYLVRGFRQNTPEDTIRGAAVIRETGII